MSDAKKERLSAFMDGELAGRGQGSAIEQLLDEPDLMKTWGRYHLVSDCLNQRLQDHPGRGLAENVSRALQDEPAIVAPVAFLRPLVRPAAGFAIAASVAALAVMGARQQQLGGPHEAPGEMATAPAGGGERAVRAPVRPVGGRVAAPAGLGAERAGWIRDNRAPATGCPERREEARERRDAPADDHNDCY